MHAIYKIAMEQGGLFSSQQAIAAGIRKGNHSYYVKTGQWERLDTGIYRLTAIEPTPEDEIRACLLWSRSRFDGTIVGVISHESALDVFGVTGVTPARVHMTVPKGFRRHTLDEDRVELHYGSLDLSEKTTHNGIQVTTAWKAVVDLLVTESFSIDYLEQAYVAARRQGLIRITDFDAMIGLSEAGIKQVTKWETQV